MMVPRVQSHLLLPIRQPTVDSGQCAQAIFEEPRRKAANVRYP
jgi:hypothetical protein